MKINNIAVIVLTVFTSTITFGQTTPKQLQKEIDRQVWKPFQTAFQNLDGEALNATYADEVLRVTPNGIDTENSFKAANLKRFAQNKADGLQIALDFWFDSRHTNSSTSYEVGFYRIAATNTQGETGYNYGQFHIVLKKIGGTWKITQDWDTTTLNGHEINADDFGRKQGLKF